MDRSNEKWLNDLATPGFPQENALADLRQQLRKGLPFALSKWLSPSDPGFEILLEDTIQDTLIRVLDRLDSFRGSSKFITWVFRIAVNIALTELRRHRWRDVSLDEMLENPISTETPTHTADLKPDPDLSVEQQDLINRIQRAIMEDLTEKQRRALILVAIQKVPMDIVAQQMKTKKNALYKLLHDARLRLKKSLAKEGLTPNEILSAFEIE